LPSRKVNKVVNFENTNVYDKKETKTRDISYFNQAKQNVNNSPEVIQSAHQNIKENKENEFSEENIVTVPQANSTAG
jgi:hypothetical protein